MTKQKKESLERQLAAPINIKDNPTPITLTISGKGETGRREIVLFLRTLSRLRVGSNARRISDNGELIVILDITRERRRNQERTTIDEYETQDGMLLTLTQNGNGGYEIDLKEDLSIGGTKQNFKDLLKRLRMAVGEVEIISTDYILGRGGEETGLVSKLRLPRIEKPESREAELLKFQQLYLNLIKTLQGRIQEVEEERRANPKSLVDDIEHFTHLGLNDLYKQIERLIPATYFLRELYGIVQARTNVTLNNIQSNKKTCPIAENRHAMMYIARNRFTFLSSPELGIVFGTPTKPKNHATVLLAQKLFDKSVGLEPKRYTDRRFIAKTLYDDAVEKRLEYLNKHPSQRSPQNLSFEEVFVMNQ